MRTFFFYCLIFLIGSTTKADDFKIEEVPQLSATKVFVSDFDPNLYLLFGRDESTGNHYVIFNDNGRLYSPKLRPNSIIYNDGGTADLNLESGIRILIPTTIQSENFLNTFLGPTVIYPNKAPDSLTPVELSEQELKTLNFSQLIAAPKAQSRPAAADHWSAYQSPQNLEEMVVVQIRLIDRLDYDTQKKIEDELRGLDANSAKLLERGNQLLFGQATLTLLASPDSIGNIQKLIPPDAVESFGIYDPQLPVIRKPNLSLSDLLSLSSSLSDSDKDLQQKAAA
ncbi:MAG: hypothetical protein KDD25_03075, partial [Bdellovibrionales bacterium]|nr:hypothetical protein [Bdellovibrionales bacterium]